MYSVSTEMYMFLNVYYVYQSCFVNMMPTLILYIYIICVYIYIICVHTYIHTHTPAGIKP